MKKVFIFLSTLALISSCSDCNKTYKPVRGAVTETITVKTDNGNKEIKRQRIEQEVIITYNDPDNAASVAKIHKDLEDKGYKLIGACPCSAKVELWQYPVGLVPNGGDIKQPDGGAGGNMAYNFVVQSLNPKDTSSVENFSTFTDGFQTPISLPTSTAKTVLVAIDDSGVDGLNNSLSPQPSATQHLFNNAPRTNFCNSTIIEGKTGMNLLKLNNPLFSSEPIDSDGHGTFIGGIIAGFCDPNIPFINYNQNNVKIQQIHSRFINERGQTGDLFTALCGIHYAMGKGAKVINTSWRVISHDSDELAIKKAFYSTMKDVKKNNNCLIVAASGNDTLNLDKEAKAWPACFAKSISATDSFDFSDNVISVGAWNLNNGKICGFSNYGSFVDVYAPGENIIGLGLNNTFSIGKGTSYATPYITRAAAIQFGLDNAATPLGVKKKILGQTTPQIISGGSPILLHDK